MKHKNIPVFVPFVGCKNKCSFCNQNAITSKAVPTSLKQAEELISGSIKGLYEKNNDLSDVQIAFFGGSFTAISIDEMTCYLKLAYYYVEKYNLNGIRISTRPDCITEEILSVLLKYKVNSIELGVQSLDDLVLLYNKRGHTSDEADRGIRLIKEFNIDLGLQMMVGLYKDTKEKLMETAKKIIDYKPKEVRIYPTVILKDTLLERLYNQKEYIPMSLDEAVESTSVLIKMFLEADIKILKVGLHSGFENEGQMVGGIYHPAFRELCDNKIYLDNLTALLKGRSGKEYVIMVKKGCMSKALGHRKENISRFNKLGYKLRFEESLEVRDYEVVLKEIE